MVVVFVTVMLATVLVMVLLVAVAVLVCMIVCHSCNVLLRQRYCRLSATRLQIRGRKVEVVDLQRVTQTGCCRLQHPVFISR